MTESQGKPLINPNIIKKEEPDPQKITFFNAQFKPFTSFGFQIENNPKLTPKYEITENENFRLTMVPVPEKSDNN